MSDTSDPGTNYVVIPAAAGTSVYLLHSDPPAEGKERPERAVLTRRTVVAWLVDPRGWDPQPVFLWNTHKDPRIIVHEDEGRFSANYRDSGVHGLYAREWLIFDSVDALKADFLRTVQQKWDLKHARHLKKRAAKTAAPGGT